MHAILPDAGYDMDELYMFDLQTHAWELIIPKGAKPAARYLHTAVLIKDTMVIFGGNDKASGDVWSFKFKSRRWTQLSKVMHEPAYLSSVPHIPSSQICTHFDSQLYAHIVKASSMHQSSYSSH